MTVPIIYLIGRSTILTQYSIVRQVPGADPYTVCAYSGTDLSQVLGITQAPRMPEGTYGWIQECGDGFVKVSGQKQAAYVDFRPNSAKLHISEGLSESIKKRPEKLPNSSLDQESFDHHKYERLSELPPLLIESGPYCSLLREARDVFVDGHFYACVAMCGISFERFQRDKAKTYGATREHKIWQVRNMLQENSALSQETIILCKNMAELRNDYAHGHGLKPKEDALKALQWMHSFIDNETNLMRDYVIVDGVLSRKPTTGGN